ncbi:Smr/MutS family protein [Phenylobacterium immobile]|uniref:Smr/MutS family protein n=1 Tax=Phenylobacterium immobile TaxID=21 RepID=UPI000A4A9D12|nr:Smr/MutS family protein [Phenylobacterium immobile]
MKRPLKPDEVKVWGLVASTVRALPGRSVPKTESVEPPPLIDPHAPAARVPPTKAKTAKAKPKSRTVLDDIEPNRRHRIARERDPVTAKLDLHGLDQYRAQQVLETFILRAWADGSRAVLVITGKGVQGDGILRRRAPEWLAAAHLVHVVAGVSHAARHHGGEGALYVALKRRPAK